MTTTEIDVVNVDISDEEDKIRVYGSTSTDNSFKSKKKINRNEESESQTDLQDQYDDDAQTQSLISSSASSSNRTSKRSGSYPTLGNSDADISVRTSRSWQYRWWQHPKVRENCRVVIGAFVLTVIGFVLLVTGVAIMISPARGWHSLVFFIGGSLFLIPGLYHVIYIYLAASGHNGYTFHNISVFS